jgi:nucleotide-binding universal stress UspA family protein
MFKLLIAIDGSEPSLRAIDAVAELAEQSGPINVVLINVRERASTLAGLSPGMKAQVEQALQRQQDRLVAAALEQARQRGLTIGSTRRAEGSAAPEIVAAAAACGAQQIVLGTRGLGAIGSLFIGSVAQRVVQLADVPVLLVK